MRFLFTASGITCLALAALSTPTASADAVSTFALATGSGCQLSIPTTNTGVRPKATGIRNESQTASNFVICPIVVTNGTTNGITGLTIGLYSLDGNTSYVSCTAVTGVFGNQMAPQIYSTKIQPISSTIGYQMVSWFGDNFGGNPGDPFYVMSVTCLLPPQTAIDFIQTNYSYEVGA